MKGKICIVKNMEIIPLGSTCSIAYQLKRLGYRKQAYPFDWVRINNLALVTNLIESDFKSFFQINSFKLNEVSNRFNVNGKMKSYIYQNSFCKFFHDFDDFINDITFKSFCEKYNRRIDRFYSVIKNSKKILFIREEIGNLSKSKLTTFSNLITKINPELEWKLKIIVGRPKYKKLQMKNVEIIYSDKKVTDWKRPELDWESIFIYE